MRKQPDVCDPNEYEGRELDWADHLRRGEDESRAEWIGFWLGFISVYLGLLAVFILLGWVLIQ